MTAMVIGVTKPLGQGGVMFIAPRYSPPSYSASRSRHRAGASHHLEGVPTNEPSRQVGLVVLLADDAGSHWTLVAFKQLVEDACDHRIWVKHQVLPYETR